MPPKLTLQLTPLLDLLLIVIFAQYMDIQQTSRRDQTTNERSVRAAREELAETLRALEMLRDERKLSGREMEQAREMLRELLRQRVNEERSAQTEISELKHSLQLAREQRDLVGDLIVELFRVPEQLLADVLQESDPGEATPPSERNKDLRKRFRELSHLRADEMVKHLLSYEELRKRCDIWDLYLTGQGVLVLSAGGRFSQFRAENPDDFQNKLFEAYKGLPQPKSLVLILLSYGDAKASSREAVLSGLPLATERMRADSNGRTRFEYTVLGYRAQRPQPAKVLAD